MNADWKKLNAVIDRFVKEGIVTGCGMRIFKDGEMVFNRSTGVSTADGSRPFTADTRLRMHSMTKNFTCAAIMTLYDQGLFALDDPIAEYLPEFANPMVCVSDTDISQVVPAADPITIRQLLSMRSGIPYWDMPGVPSEGIVQAEYLKMAQKIASRVSGGETNTLENLVKDIAKMPLCFQPGERWMYGLSLTVIGRLIEVLSGMKISDYMKKTLWEPLGMTKTCFVTQLQGSEQIGEVMIPAELAEPMGLNPDVISHPAGREDVFCSRVDVLPGTNLGVELPCGGLISTMNDIGRLFAMFAGGGELDGVRVLGRRTIDLMRTNQLTPEQLPDFAVMTNKGFGYGLGYRTMLDPSDAGFYMPAGSFGWDGASGCYGLANPDEKLAIVFAESSVPHHIIYTVPRVVAAMNADRNW